MRKAPLVIALSLLCAASGARADNDGFGQIQVSFDSQNQYRGQTAPAESPCPVEPPASAYSGPRRGIGIGVTRGPSKLLPEEILTPQNGAEIVQLLSPTWYYTWSLTPLEGASLQFIPLVLTEGQGAAGAEAARALGAPALLGYNEPDIGWRGGTSQKVSTTTTLGPAGWSKMAAQVPASIEIGSPAMAMNFVKGGGWMDAFMAGRPRVDFVAMHWYGPANFGQFQKDVKKMYALYCRPIWITEFGVFAWHATAVNDADAATLKNDYRKRIMPSGPSPVMSPATIDGTQEFMRQALAWLDGAEGPRYVQRYSWDEPPEPLPPTNATDVLWYKDAQGKVVLTPLGRIYAR